MVRQAHYFTSNELRVLLSLLNLAKSMKCKTDDRTVDNLMTSLENDLGKRSESWWNNG